MESWIEFLEKYAKNKGNELLLGLLEFEKEHQYGFEKQLIWMGLEIIEDLVVEIGKLELENKELKNNLPPSFLFP